MNLKVENINKSFINNKKQNLVLDNISFNIDEGRFVTILGPSGCGKTTLLRIIAGFEKASSGKVLLNGTEVLAPGPDRGFVFQNYALFPWMTVKDNIMYPMKQQKISKDGMLEKTNHLLKMAKLLGKENLYPSQLSGGMKQRTAVIRALACNPQILLMDEPLGAIDFHMRQIMQEELESLWLQNKTTVIMVTHDVEEAIYLSDRIIVLSSNGGKIISDVNINLVRPRDRDSEEYIKYKKNLTSILKESLKESYIY